MEFSFWIALLNPVKICIVVQNEDGVVAVGFFQWCLNMRKLLRLCVYGGMCCVYVCVCDMWSCVQMNSNKCVEKIQPKSAGGFVLSSET